MHSIPPHITHQPLLPTGQSDLRGPFDDAFYVKIYRVNLAKLLKMGTQK